MGKSGIEIEEGKIFAVPLSGGVFAIGLIARCHDDEILAYFLNKAYINLSSVDAIVFGKDNIIYIAQASALGLKKGIWPILGALQNWNRDEWGMPIFYKVSSIDDTRWKIFYDDKFKFLKQEVMDESDNINLYPKDGLGGYGFIEKKLSMFYDEGKIKSNER